MGGRGRPWEGGGAPMGEGEGGAHGRKGGAIEGSFGVFWGLWRSLGVFGGLWRSLGVFWCLWGLWGSLWVFGRHVGCLLEQGAYNSQCSRSVLVV
jgi:hypothetical protein